MPGLKVAVANGNWSSAATWNGGTLPSAGDTVASNGFTVTIDQDINVDLLTNTSVGTTSLIPIMTSYTAPSGTVTFSTEYDANTYAAWKAFDGSIVANSNHWLSQNGTFVSPQWVTYEFPSPVLVNGYSLASTYTMPRDFQLLAWNGSSWDTLVSVTANVATFVSGTFANSTSYARYRLNITANNSANYTSIGELKLFPAGYAVAPPTAGGGFVVSSGVTITCTNVNGVLSGPATALTVSANSPQTVTLNSNITCSSTTNSINTLVKSGTCTFNVNGSTRVTTSGISRHCLAVTGAGTINFVGSVNGAWQNSYGIVMTTGSTGAVLNIVGDINSAKLINSSQNELHLVIGTICTVNITGNIYGGWGNSVGVSIGAAANVYVTGNVYGGTAGSPGISSAQAGLLSIIGIIGTQHTAGYDNPGVVSTSTSGINLFSGPFISSTYGIVPFLCNRMHLIPTTTSYYEFRDETTNGALSPGAIAPATRMLSPAGVSDSPIPANVRFGTVYANGSLTGTCRIPAVNTVAAGIAVDNTVGTAVLSPADVWNVQTSTLTTSGSIGERLKNVSTVQTTAEQLASLS